ncbi:MAG: HAD-IC family P-type ATPase [Verrucomicrobiota bacterium]|nr:HAD-IC family P-type ATPase [Verrucomicrobiota bacterium]
MDSRLHRDGWPNDSGRSARGRCRGRPGPGSSVALVSGDRAAAAEMVARASGIEEVHADLTPNEKLEWIQRWRREGKTVAMVGDGINDAPSLTAADVSLGMGARGSDAALAQSDVILMHDRIENVPTALRLSRRARRIIRQNLYLVTHSRGPGRLCPGAEDQALARGGRPRRQYRGRGLERPAPAADQA